MDEISRKVGTKRYESKGSSNSERRALAGVVCRTPTPPPAFRLSASSLVQANRALDPLVGLAGNIQCLFEAINDEVLEVREGHFVL